MPWAKFSDDAQRSERILALSIPARWFWAAAIMENRGYRGGRSAFISTVRATALARQQGIRPKLIRELEAKGRWEPVDGGWNIHHYEQFLPSLRELQEDREPDPVKSAAGSKGAASRWQTDGNAHGRSNGRPMAGPKQTDGPARARARGPVPVPSPVPGSPDVSATPHSADAEALILESEVSLSPLHQVFRAWIQSTERTGRTELDDKRRRLIQNALKTYPLEDVLDAVDGWRFDAHHRGENDRGRPYNDLGLVLRDPEHIERFRDFKRRPVSVVMPARKPSMSAVYRDRAAALREVGD